MTIQEHVKNTFKHALIYSGSSILSRIVGFIMLPLYSHYLRGEGYGIIGMIDVVLSIMTLVVGHGIAGAMGRFYFEYETEQDRKTLVSTTISVMFVLVLIVSLPVLIFNESVAVLALGSSKYGYFLVISTLAFICEMTSKTPEAYILLRQKSILISFFALGRLILGLSLNIYLIVYLQMGVLGYLYSALTVGVLSTIVLHAYALSYVGLSFQKIIVEKIFRYSLPLLPGYFAMFIRGNADRVILRTYLGLSQLGAFEVMFKFATLLGVFVVVPFSRIWNVKRYEICDSPEGPETMARMFTLQLALLLFFGGILMVEIPILLRVMTPQEFWLGGGIVLLAVSSRILQAAYDQVNFGLLYAKKTSHISIIYGITAILSVGLNLLLISRYGIFGAVLSSCLVSICQCLMGHYMSRVYYPIPFQWKRISKMTLAAGVIFFAIGQVSVNGLGLSGWLKESLAPGTIAFMQVMHLDSIKNGKLLLYVAGNIPLVFEGAIKLVLSMTFLPVLACLGVVPWRFLNIFYVWEKLHHVLRGRGKK